MSRRPRLPAARVAVLTALALAVAACDPSSDAPETPAVETSAAPASGTPAAAPDPAAPRDGTATTSVPPGYELRLDPWARGRSGFSVLPLDDGGLLRVRTGPPGILWRPQDLTGGEPFRLEAAFTQLEDDPSHTEAYGIFVGGRDLDGPYMAYTYVLLRGTGDFTVKQWRGETTEIVVDWSPHEALRRIGEEGEARNTLVVDAAPDSTRFLANGALLATLPSDLVWPVGIAGLRVNEELELRLESWSIETTEPPPTSRDDGGS